jgi:site-specific recombinase XerD
VVRPKESAASKFSGVGLVRAEALMPKLRSQKTAEALARKANFGLASTTHETYKTAVNHLKRCQDETGVEMCLPFDQVKTLEFLGWMEARGLKSRSMSTYLSGVRGYHIASGFKDPFLRDPMVRLI